MAATEKTRTPGIFKRGGRYVFSYRADGKQHWESCRTLDEARRLKQVRTADIARGEFEQRSRLTLHEYARDWVERYQGRGRRGFRENTRDEYRRQLERFVFEYFSSSLRLTELTPSKIAAFVAWLSDEQREGKVLADATIRRTLSPLRACLASAVREGVIRSNPARDVDLPHRPTIEGVDSDGIHAMSREELSTLLALMPDDWRPLFWFLAATGLRISEAIALRWEDLQLSGATPRVTVRRALVKGRLGPPKSRHGRRDVPLPKDLAAVLSRTRRASRWQGDEDLVFPARNGSPLMPGNVRRRVLVPAAEKAGVPWVGFHAFRHTCASMLFADGRNAVQVQRWLGHHSAAFTLATYVHLLDGDVGEPLDVARRARRRQVGKAQGRAPRTRAKAGT